MSSTSQRTEREPAEGGRETVDEALKNDEPKAENENEDEVVADPDGARLHIDLPAA